MKKFSISLLAGFVVNNMVGTLVAMFVAKPLVGEVMAQFERSSDTLEMPALLSGYFLLTLMMVIAYPYLKMEGNWLRKGVKWGLLAGLMSFVSIYLIISGWSILPPQQMLISAVIDVSSTVATGIVIAFVYRNQA